MDDKPKNAVKCPVADTDIKVTPEMVKAGIKAWGRESGFCGPPDVDGEEVVVAIFKAMVSLCDAK
jgi:hypothetical protein